MTIRWRDSSPALELPVLADRGDLVDVFIDPIAEEVVRQHLGAAPVEQGGLLIGRAWGGPDGTVTHVAIEKAVPADESEGTSVSLRMATPVWERAREALADGERIVGWYHSHPGLTAFFSDTDRQTQAAFFSHPYSVGWVVDPLLGDEALFLGPTSRPVDRGPDARPRDDAAGR